MFFSNLEIILEIKLENFIISFFDISFNLLYIYIYICKDQIGLESRTGMDPGLRSPNNKFIECRKGSQSESWAKILGFSVKGLELQVQFMQRVSSDMSQCYGFRIIFCPFSFFLFPFSFLRLIYYGFFTFFLIHVWTWR